MKLIPREQWICDACGEIIQNASEGWLEFETDRNHIRHNFRIVHHVSYSPRNPYRPDGARLKGQSCYDELSCTSSHHLNHVVGSGGIAILLGMVDVGPELHPEYRGPSVDLREWVELMRRLTIPYYEEARQHWNVARADGIFDGANDLLLYSEKMLKHIVEHYSKPSR